MFSATVKVSLNTAITNRISTTSVPGGAAVTGIVFTVDSGSGPQPVLMPPVLTGATSIAYEDVPIAFSPQGGVNLAISGIRADAYALPPPLPIVASLSINSAPLALTSAQLTTGATDHGLFASYTATFICAQSGSPLPSTLDFNDLISAGTAVETVRATEGFADAFQPLSGFENFNADSGERHADPVHRLSGRFAVYCARRGRRNGCPETHLGRRFRTRPVRWNLRALRQRFAAAGASQQRGFQRRGRNARLSAQLHRLRRRQFQQRLSNPRGLRRLRLRGL